MTHAFDIYLNKKYLDTVFYTDSYVNPFNTIKDIKEDVKKSLINHDGYNPDIKIVHKRKG